MTALDSTTCTPQDSSRVTQHLRHENALCMELSSPDLPRGTSPWKLPRGKQRSLTLLTGKLGCGATLLAASCVKFVTAARFRVKAVCAFELYLERLRLHLLRKLHQKPFFVPVHYRRNTLHV